MCHSSTDEPAGKQRIVYITVRLVGLKFHINITDSYAIDTHQCINSTPLCTTGQTVASQILSQQNIRAFSNKL